MNLREVISAMYGPDDIDAEAALDLEVEFCTVDRGGMKLLSVYANDEKTVIFIDIGTDSIEEKEIERLHF